MQRSLAGPHLAPAAELGGCAVVDRVSLRDAGWSIEEILHSSALVAEGRVLRHCVATYELRCLRGASSIWSLRRQVEDDAPRSSFTGCVVGEEEPLLPGPQRDARRARTTCYDGLDRIHLAAVSPSLPAPPPRRWSPSPTWSAGDPSGGSSRPQKWRGWAANRPDVC